MLVSMSVHVCPRYFSAFDATYHSKKLRLYYRMYPQLISVGIPGECEVQCADPVPVECEVTSIWM